MILGCLSKLNLLTNNLLWQLKIYYKKDQQILSTNINKLQGNLELIKSSNNILNLNKQMRLSESNYKSSDDIFISFDKNYKKVEKY